MSPLAVDRAPVTRCRRAVVLVLCGCVVTAFPLAIATGAAPDLGWHVALEGRAAAADEASRWRRAASGQEDAFLYDLAATLRPLASGTWGNIRFNTEVELTAIAGDTIRRTGTTLASQPSALEDELLDLAHVWSRGSGHRHTARVDRLAAVWSPAWGTVTLGRQAVTWGGGLVFNPFDLFNPFAPGDVFRDYKLGADMLHVDVPLGDGGWQALVVGRRDALTGEPSLRASSWATQWQRRVGAGEVSLMAAWHHDARVLGAGVAGVLGGAAWRVDGTWVRVRVPGLDRSDDYAALVANVQYSWVWAGQNVFGFLEYHHSTLGTTNYAEAVFDPFLLTQLARRNVFLLGRDYLAASLQVEVHPLVNVFLSAIANLRDPSAVLQPRVVWNASDRAEVTAGLDVPVGATGTEFGGFDPGDGCGTTRAPVSLYVRATWDW